MCCRCMRSASASRCPQRTRTMRPASASSICAASHCPISALRSWFELTSERPPRENVVVVELDGAKAGLAVDSLHGARQTVIKPLGERFQDLPGILRLGDYRVTAEWR